MTHRRDEYRRGNWGALLSWQTGLRLLGAGGFVVLLFSDGERFMYMVGCIALATFGLPGAIRFDRGAKEKDEV